MGRARNMPNRPPHLAGITQLSRKFSGMEYRVEIRCGYEKITCGHYQDHARAVIARRLALHWIKAGYQLTGVYQYERK